LHAQPFLQEEKAMKRRDKRASGDYQRAVGEFVGREVIYGVSALVAEIGKTKIDDWLHLFAQDDWKSAVCEAIGTLPSDELREFLTVNDCAADEGADGLTLSRACLRILETGNSWQEFAEAHGIEPQQHEIYEHWIVSDWLAARLEQRGELIERDFYGLTIWGRACTGQAILLDAVICAVYDEAHPEKAATIAELNDSFRLNFFVPSFGPRPVPGHFVCTAGILALPPETQICVWSEVSEFSAFSDDNDPHGEHDFGAFDIDGTGKIFWKIDYYADASCSFGSEDPSDITRCHRVMTIMRAEEY
jgi:hypothetical protein